MVIFNQNLDNTMPLVLQTLIIKEDGTEEGVVNTIDFTGDVDVSVAANVATVNVTNTGGTPLLPTTGTGTATGAVTGNLDGNNLDINSSFGAGILINPGDGKVRLTNTDGSKVIYVSNDDDKTLVQYNSSTKIELGNGSNTITHTADTHTFNAGGRNNGSITLAESYIASFDPTSDGNRGQIDVVSTSADVIWRLTADFNDGVKAATIQAIANATTSTITHTADTHTFNMDGVLKASFGGNNLLYLDSTAGSESSLIEATNITGDGNISQVVAGATNTLATFRTSASFNDDAKLAKIVGNADATTATITHTADDHNLVGRVNITGNEIPTADNTYDLGDATHRWANIHVMGSSLKIYGASTGVISLTAQSAAGTYNFNMPTGAGSSGQPLLSGGGAGAAMTFGTLGVAAGGTGITGGTSGGIPYFSGTGTIASSGLLAANALVVGGGAATTPATVTTGTGVLTALAANVGSAGAVVTFNGALGTPSSGTLSSCTGLPISTGVSGLGTNVATFLGTPSSANLLAALTDETGSGKAVFATSPTFTTSILLAGSTSGNVTLNSDALSNTPQATTLTGLGVVPSVSFYIIQGSDFTLGDNNGDQSAFPAAGDVWTLAGSTTYYMEGLYYITSGAASHSIAIGFTLGGSASISSILYSALSWPVAINTATATQTTTTITQVASTAVNSAGATAVQYVTFHGHIRMNVGGTVTPILKFSGAPGGTNLMKQDSYIRFTPVGTNTVSGVGPVA